MLYALVGESFWGDGTLSVRGLPTPYYSLLYPVVAGLPLQLGDMADAIRAAQLLQALLMSSAAIPVYLWGRRFLASWLALSAAALSLLVPALAYSGLLMTEALFYPLAVLSLAALARVLDQPNAWNQGVFLFCATAATAVRMQALVLLPTFVVAAALHARMTRSTATLRRLGPLLAAGLAVSAGAVLYLLVSGAGWEDILGAYGTLGQDTQLSAGVLREFGWHLAGAGLITLGVPLLATAILVAAALRSGDPDPSAGSFLATTTAYVGLLVVQVGLFSATHLTHVSERYLVTVAPPLLLGLCLWVARGAPRPRWIAAGAAAALVALVLTTPAGRLVPPTGVHDTPSSAALLLLRDATSAGWSKAALVAGALLAVALVYLVRPRTAVALLVLVALGLSAQSVVATRKMRDTSAAEQRAALGTASRTWIDDAGADRVTLLATSDRPWPADARTFFWNHSVAGVVALDEIERPVPPSLVRAAVIPDTGAVVDVQGHPVTRPMVAAPSTFVLAGTRIAEEQPLGAETVGLVLWKLSEPLRVLERHVGFLPNGDLTSKGEVRVGSCRRGRLEMTLLGKSGAPIDVWVNGRHMTTLVPRPGEVLHAAIPGPRYADGSGPCFYQLQTTNLVGSTRIEYVAD